jgi:hypothetical protein
MDYAIPKTFNLSSDLLGNDEFRQLLKKVEGALLENPFVLVQTPFVSAKRDSLFLSVADGNGGEQFEVEFQNEKESHVVNRHDFEEIFSGSVDYPQGTVEEILARTLESKENKAYAENLTWCSDKVSFDLGNAVPFKLVPVTFSEHIGGFQIQKTESDSGLMSTLSATNWVKTAQGIYKPAMEIPGVTLGSPIYASAGAGTVLHVEQGLLPSVNANHSGWKAWQVGTGLLKWRESQGGSCIDALAKDVLKWATPEECKRFGILVFLQPPGSTAFTASGVWHTVVSLTATIADASNIFLNQSFWTGAFRTASRQESPSGIVGNKAKCLKILSRSNDWPGISNTPLRYWVQSRYLQQNTLSTA